MRYLLQLLYILGFTLLGELAHLLLPLPIPAAIYGLVLLFLALMTGLVRLEQIRSTADFLIGIMSILFVSPAVGLVETWDVIRGSLLPITVILLVSTFAVFASAALVTRFFLKKGGSSND